MHWLSLLITGKATDEIVFGLRWIAGREPLFAFGMIR